MHVFRMVMLVALFAWSTALGSTESGRDMVKEGKIEVELARMNAAMVEPFRAARIAMDKGDFRETIQLLEPVCKSVPEFDVAQRRLGIALAETGQKAEGIPHGEKAVALRRSSENLSSLAIILVADGKAALEEQLRAYSLLEEAIPLPDGKDEGNLVLFTGLALQLHKAEAFRNGVAELRQLFPEVMQTHYFSALQAVRQEHWMQARKEILKAGELGLDQAEVQRFLNSGVGSRAKTSQYLSIAGWTVGGWAAGIVLLCGLGFALSKMTLRQIEKTSATARVTAGEQGLRSVYRWLLNLAGIYYYISLPIVLLLVIAICGGVLYLCLLIGQIPIKLVVLLVIGSLMTIWSMVRSLFIRIPNAAPGRPLERAEAEELWRVTEEVAAELHTRPVDEIRVTGGTDLCVYERGSWLEKIRNRAKRVLVLGTALLPEFRQEDFRCVLAHEYGHFSHRDTAGGDVALRVQNDMVKFYLAMCSAGQATALNVAFHFLRTYHFIFRRISCGATRLQEVLADRVAAQLYGAAAFEGGLSHVIRRSVAFDQRANREIKEAIEGARPLRNLYHLPAFEPGQEEHAFQKAMNRPTTEDDTHPGPKDRFRYIAGLPARSASSEGFVWQLFRNPQAITEEMVAEIEKRVAEHRRYPAPSKPKPAQVPPAPAS